MTEREYIDATNLAKIRAAKTIVYDALSMTDDEKKDQGDALASLRR